MRSVTEKIASSIQLLLQLPDDCSLVEILGEGTEDNNHKALEFWVAQQVDLLAQENSRLRIRKFVERLIEDLESCNDFFTRR